MQDQSSEGKKRYLQIGIFINKLRVLQGWNMLGVKDVQHIAAAWHEQLVRYGVPEAMFNELVDRVMDRRIEAIQQGKEPPTASIELVLATFMDEKALIHNRLKTQRHRLESERRYLRMLCPDPPPKDADDRQALLALQSWAVEHKIATDLISLDNAIAQIKANIAKYSQEVEKWEAKLALLQQAN